MKKFYSTAIAALCALGVSATINVGQMRTGFTGLRHNVTDELNKIEKVADRTPFKNIEFKKISSRAEGDAPESIAGKYYINIGDLFFETSVGDVMDVATIEQEGNTITIVCDFLATPLVGTYNAETGEITFSNIKVGKIQIPESETEIGEYYLQIEPFTDVDENGPVIGTYSVTYNADYGVITFPDYHGFSWTLYSDPRYGIFAGYLDALLIYDLEAYENWSYLGEGVFTDNNMAAAFLKEPIAPYSVDVFQSNLFEDYYKVLDPWKGLYAGLNFKGSSPAIYLDAADPDNVLLEAVSTGIVTQQNGEYMVFNDGWYCEFIAKDPSKTEAFTTLTKEDGYLTFTFEPLSIMLMGLSSGAFYYAGDETCESTLVIPLTGAENSGVSDITVDENAPVEYFNLQGVRIDNPAAGQVVIKRQGAKVTKTLFR